MLSPLQRRFVKGPNGPNPSIRRRQRAPRSGEVVQGRPPREDGLRLGAWMRALDMREMRLPGTRAALDLSIAAAEAGVAVAAVRSRRGKIVRNWGQLGFELRAMDEGVRFVTSLLVRLAEEDAAGITVTLGTLDIMIKQTRSRPPDLAGGMPIGPVE